MRWTNDFFGQISQKERLKVQTETGNSGYSRIPVKENKRAGSSGRILNVGSNCFLKGEEVMARRADLTGKRFGKLTVIGQTDEIQDRYRVWRCRCDCGGEIPVNTKRLTRGTVKDCGCVPRETARKGCIAEDLTGRQFGSLTVLHRAENLNGRTAWLCSCICGREKTATAKDLKAGNVKSCGCLVHEHRHNTVDLTGKRFGRLTA